MGRANALEHEPQQPSAADRLDSWKEIAVYLKRSVRTVHRWESEQGLPVHRHLHQSSGTVYAFKPELDAWWASRRAELGSVTEAPEEIPAREETPARTETRSTGRLFRWILLATSLAAVVIALYAGRDRLLRWVHPTSIGSVAVLPLENLTGDRALDPVVDAMTDGLTTELARTRLLGVTSRTSAAQYRAAHKPLRAIAKELNVDAVIEGTVSRSGELLQVNTQLILASSDRHLWAQHYDRGLGGVQDLQSEIAWDILRSVSANMQSGQHPGLVHRRPANPEAYEAYVKGRFFLSTRGPGSLKKSLKYFQEAIQADPSYAPAYSGLSDTYRTLNGGVPPGDCLPKAEGAARRALELDATLADAHVSLANVLDRYHWDWAGAEKEFRRALELDPNYAEGHRAYGIHLLTLNRIEEGLSELQRARQLSPLSVQINTELTAALNMAGRFDEAIEQLKQTEEIAPNPDLMGLAAAYAGKGDTSRALALLQQNVARLMTTTSNARPPGRSAALMWLGYGYAVTGRKREAQAVLAALKEEAAKSYISPQKFALIYLGLGDKERALDFLEKSFADRGSLDLFLLTTKWFDPLRTEPRFQAILRGVGLPLERRPVPPNSHVALSAIQPKTNNRTH